MKDTEFIIAIAIAVLIGTVVVFTNKKGVKFQFALLTAATAYMLVHAILHPESNSKFFALIGLIFIIQNLKKIKGQSQT